MKHSFFCFTLISTLFTVGFLSSCQKDNLPSLTAPTVTVAEFNIYGDSLSFSWEAVENATGYTYLLQGLDEEEVTTTETSVTFPGLPVGSYTFKVKAVVPAGDKTWSDSQFAEATAELVNPIGIEIVDITDTWATTVTTPDDDKMYYYVDVIEKPIFIEKYHSSYYELAVQYLSEWQMIAAMMQKHPADYAYQGKYTFTYEDNLPADTEFVSFAFGILGPDVCDGQGNIICTRICIGPDFKTNAAGQSSAAPAMTNSVIRRTF